MANLSQEIEQILRSRLKEQDIDLDIDIDISDEMKQSTITDIADTVINSVKEAVLADPRVASRMDRLRVSAAGQMEAVKAHLDRTRDEMLEDTVVAAKRDMAAIVKEVIQKIVRESVKISFTAKDIDEFRAGIEEVKAEIREELLDELRAELREESQSDVSLPHRPVSSSGGKKRGRKPKGA